MIRTAAHRLVRTVVLALAVVGALILAPAALAKSDCHGRCAVASRAHRSAKHSVKHHGAGARASHGQPTGAATSPAPSSHGGAPAAMAPTCDDGSKYTLIGDTLSCADGSGPVCANGYDPTLSSNGTTITCAGATSADNGQATCDDGTTPTVESDGSLSCDDGSDPTCPDGTSPTVAADGSTLVCDAPGSGSGSSGSGGSGDDGSGDDGSGDDLQGLCADGTDPYVADDGTLVCDDGSTPQCADGTTPSLAGDGSTILCDGAPAAEVGDGLGSGFGDGDGNGDGSGSGGS